MDRLRPSRCRQGKIAGQARNDGGDGRCYWGPGEQLDPLPSGQDCGRPAMTQVEGQAAANVRVSRLWRISGFLCCLGHGRGRGCAPVFDGGYLGDDRQGYLGRLF